MKSPELSLYYKSRKPSPIRLSQIEFANRKDDVEGLNVAIGNVSLSMHPSMIKRLKSLGDDKNPFSSGVVSYTTTGGTIEANSAIKNIIASSGLDSSKLFSIITDGGSQSMELVVLGCCGESGSNKKPLLLIDPAYSNYVSMCKRTGRSFVSVGRSMDEFGKFTIPSAKEIEEVVEANDPGAMVVIPYDNPTGQFMSREKMIELAKICVKYNIWMISDEAYRELFYTDNTVSSIWALNDSIVKGIEGRRISIESASKVWNACGLRIGSLVSDNHEFIQKAQAEYTANLCANAIGQYVFGALANESKENLQMWYTSQRNYYKDMMFRLRTELISLVPGVIVSAPDAALYSVIDVKNIAKDGFNSEEFSLFCSKVGKVLIEGRYYTLMIAPMAGFYIGEKCKKLELTQMRIAYVLPPDKMKLVPKLFSILFNEYEKSR